MDPVTAIGLASSLVQCISFTREICSLLKEYSAIATAPREILEDCERLERTLKTLVDISSSQRNLTQNDVDGIEGFIKKAEAFHSYLEGFKIKSPASEANGTTPGWFDLMFEGYDQPFGSSWRRTR